MNIVRGEKFASRGVILTAFRNIRKTKEYLAAKIDGARGMAATLRTIKEVPEAMKLEAERAFNNLRETCDVQINNSDAHVRIRRELSRAISRMTPAETWSLYKAPVFAQFFPVIDKGDAELSEDAEVSK